MIRYNDGNAENMTHCEATQNLVFSAFIAGYGAALLAVLQDNE